MINKNELNQMIDKVVAAKLALEAATRKVYIVKHTEELLDYVDGALCAIYETETAKRQFNQALANYTEVYVKLCGALVEIGAQDQNIFDPGYKVIEDCLARLAVKA
jgi:hypothetical protein